MDIRVHGLNELTSNLKQMTITIITINYNNLRGLRNTLKSISEQSCQDFEYIIIDGGSTDGSKELIEEFSVVFRSVNFRWVSEIDRGIYHAMNKGIQMANGEYVQFLNSGDWLVDMHVVENVLSQLDGDIVVGNVIQVNEKGKLKYCKHDIAEISFYTFYRGTIQHSSAYIRRELFFNYGLYDETLRIVSDWKWYLKVIIFEGVKVSLIDDYISFFDMTGISSTNHLLDRMERRQVLQSIIPDKILKDYDQYSFYIDQMKRLSRYKLYKPIWFLERVLFKIDKLKKR